MSALRVGGVDGRGLIEPWLATFGEIWVDPSAEGTWSEVEGQSTYTVKGEHVHVALIPLPDALVTLVAPNAMFEPHLAGLVRHLLSIGD